MRKGEKWAWKRRRMEGRRERRACGGMLVNVESGYEYLGVIVVFFSMLGYSQKIFK